MSHCKKGGGDTANGPEGLDEASTGSDLPSDQYPSLPVYD
jgi:hypothetical protein